MSLNNEQKHQLNKLIDHRDNIVSSLFQIERILKQYFPEEFDLAYQHYIPQITTALYEDKKWLSRGGYSMQDTINNLMDKVQDEKVSGVNKYI
jgi:flagellar biosynthesis chaperone FliJ